MFVDEYLIDLFQSTLPQGERPISGASASQRYIFQPTPPQGERHSAAQFLAALQGFQPTLPRGERLTFSHTSSSVTLFQSSPPQGERHTGGDNPDAPEVISTRAPAGGATNSPKGIVASFRFQPTLPRGERHKRGERFRHVYISTHAPAWGATPTIWRARNDCIYFNPRSRVGSDCNTWALFTSQVFQPTLPRGERP